MNQKPSEDIDSEPLEIGALDISPPSELIGEVEGLIPQGGISGLPDLPSSTESPDLFAAPEASSIDELLPGEPSDPVEGLEHLLDSAVAEDGLDPILDGGVALSSVDVSAKSVDFRPFQLELSKIPESLKAEWEKLIASLGLANANQDGPLLSRLNEYEVLLLLHQGRKLGLSVTPRMGQWTGNVLSEEDIALGDLSQVLEAKEVSIGAPAVSLPAGEANLPLFTAAAPAYGEVRETKGLVTAHRSIARRLFREEELQQKLTQELSRLGKSQGLPASKIDQTIDDLVKDLRISALALGANAVVGLRLMGFSETDGLEEGNQQVRLVASGTAIVVEK
jgi:uncharacterized protein YbjQ (UPF0145 family)